MYFEKVLNHPNVVGLVMIALLFCAGFVYAFAFDGFHVETVSSAEVDAWLAAASGVSNSGNPQTYRCKCSYRSKGLCDCKSSTKPNNKPCGGKKADGCQSSCRQDNHGCTNQGGCIREVCKNSNLKGTR